MVNTKRGGKQKSVKALFSIPVNIKGARHLSFSNAWRLLHTIMLQLLIFLMLFLEIVKDIRN